MNMIVMIPGFRIKNKQDVETFINKVLMPNNTYTISCITENEQENFQLIIDKKGLTNISVYTRIGNLKDCFNPMLEIASTTNDIYNTTVNDVIWDYRKLINNEFLKRQG